MRLMIPFAGLAAALIALSTPPAMAGELVPAACPTPKTLVKLGYPLTQTSQKLRAGEDITIVAIGSSSTAGAGSSSPDASYPSRLQKLLRERFPQARINVINRGINGQDAPEMLARFDKDVAAYKPSIVIWQAGVNALFRENGMANAESLLREAIDRVQAIGADLVLVDPQYAPRVLADDDTEGMIRLIQDIAREKGIGVYTRFALMRDWHESARVDFSTFLWKDRFHMNDWGYDCFARDLGRALAAGFEAPQRSADVGTQRSLKSASTSAPVVQP